MTTSLGAPNAVAIAFFLLFILLSLGITYWAARRTRSTEQFYAAGRQITALQNGLALAGDYMSAASFLGIAGLVARSGFDGLISPATSCGCCSACPTIRRSSSSAPSCSPTCSLAA